MTRQQDQVQALDRRAVVNSLLAERGNLLVIAGLGAPAWDATAAGDHPLTFPLWGAMGGAVMIGLGLALAQPTRPVLVVTGDGELLMGLGSLATVGVSAPRNLSVVVLDNERYGETGMQPTHTAFGIDLAAVATACRFASVSLIDTQSGVAGLRDAVHAMRGPLFAQVKVAADKLKLVLPPRDGAHLKNRFREALLGADAHLQR
jgi:thiamine pyrophosphate-dependent acetolactate synthase large subunit-like protein